MKHLYVIGNGFDCHHDMQTKYEHFCSWLADSRKYRKVLKEIYEFFDIGEDNWWSTFEENLATANMLDFAIEAVKENNPDYGSDDFSDGIWEAAKDSVMEKLEEIYEHIREAFRAWVCQMPEGKRTKMIHMDIENGVFLSFNYTATLEDLYGVPASRILYIHGKANSNEKLVLGHGATLEQLEKKIDNDARDKFLHENVDVDDCEFDYTDEDLVMSNAKYGAAEGVYAQRKHVRDIINKHSEWFSQLSDVDKIHIYGHSFGKIDLPYFRKIFESVNETFHVEVSWFDDDTKERIKDFMNAERITDYRLVQLAEL